MKPTIPTSFDPTQAEKRQMEAKGFRYDPIRGFINTRDPGWLAVWILVFWALALYGLYWIVTNW